VKATIAIAPLGKTEFEAIAKAKAALEAQLAMGRFVEIEVY
jgi:hypothetical protein